MKKTTGIFISAAAIFSFAAVVAVQAQDSMMYGDTNSSGDQTVSNVNQNVNSDSNVNADANTNTTMNAGDNTNTQLPPQPVLTSKNPVPSAQKPPSGEKSSSSGKLEKIPTPDHIKLFTNIRQIGNSLFGILKNFESEMGRGQGQTATGTMPSTGSEPNPSSTVMPSGQNFEKILNPDLVKFFTNIKKIGTSLFGKRIAGHNPPRIVTSDESACVIAAIKVKDQAATAAVNAYASAFTAAVSARTDCQVAALGSTDGQQDALAKCVKDFRAAATQAKTDQVKAQNTAWSDYRTALHACAPAASSVNANANANSPTTGAGGEILIEDGGDIIQ